jgi:hypothetical protein
LGAESVIARRSRRWYARGVALAALLLGIGVSIAASNPADRPESVHHATPSVFRVQVRATEDGLTRLAAEGFDIAGRDLQAGWVEVITDASGFAWLERNGYELDILERRDRPRPLRRAGSPDTKAISPGYTDLMELEAFLLQVGADHPDIVRLEVIGASIEGRPILAMMISDNPAEDEDELTVLFSGAHHAREVMTTEAVMDVIEFLTDNYGVDPAVTAKVDAYQIWCVPVTNPDGLHIVFTDDDLWRKNARDNDNNGRRTWKDGVDTNRNYEWAWGEQCLGSSDGVASAVYHGPAPATEPETVAMIELGRRLRPVFDIEYHSYGEDVFYAMGCDPAFSPTLDTIQGADQSISRVVGEQYAARLVKANGAVGFLPSPFGNRVDGIGRDQQAHENGSIAFVTELNSAGEGGFHPDYDTYRDSTIEGQRPGWLWLIDRMAGPAVGGHVTDASTGTPVLADISLDEMHIHDGRRLTTHPATGRFHIIVVPGTYTLRVNAPGYFEEIVSVAVGDGWAPVSVQLRQDASSRLAWTDLEDPGVTSFWTVGAADDDAASGVWEWGAPRGTHTGDVVTGDLEIGGPSFDRTAGEGKNAFVTGNEPGASFDQDDVDRGTTSLVSPVYDLEEWYAVEFSWQQWLRTEVTDPLDGLTLEVSTDDGQSWAPVAFWNETTSSSGFSPAWADESVRLDDHVRPGSATRLRFRATDDGPKNVVEAGIDDLEIRGYSLEGQGRVTEVRFPGPDRSSLQWGSVPGAPDALYEVARGSLENLGAGPTSVELGPLDCLAAAGAGETSLVDAETPAAGSGWFDLVRFRLGYTVGDCGTASNGLPRGSETVCP